MFGVPAGREGELSVAVADEMQMQRLILILIESPSGRWWLWIVFVLFVVVLVVNEVQNFHFLARNCDVDQGTKLYSDEISSHVSAKPLRIAPGFTLADGWPCQTPRGELHYRH